MGTASLSLTAWSRANPVDVLAAPVAERQVQARKSCFQAGKRRESAAREDEALERMLPVSGPGCPCRK